MRRLLALAAFVLSCNPTAKPEHDNKMRNFDARRQVQLEDYHQWQNYGQAQDFPTASLPFTTDGQTRDVLRWQQETSSAPVVHTLMLAIDLSAAVNPSNHAWRWSLALGVGGAKRVFLIDAIGAQQISVPISTADILLVCERANIDAPFVAPTYDVKALAYVAQTNTYSRLATLTQWRSIGAASAITMPIPVGANAWKLMGIGDPALATSIFVAGVTFAFSVAAVPPMSDTYLGSQLLTPHLSGDHLPINGSAKNLSINNTTGNPLQFAIQWSIDF